MPLHKKETIAEESFLNKRPRWNREWKKNDYGMVEIIMPKFGKHPIGTWLMKHMQKPTYRLKLDEVGSFVWERCDGTYKVEEIGQLLQEKFGEKVEPVFERLMLFFRQLEKIKSIIWV